MYLTLSKGEEFKFAHCWTILKDTEKFSRAPSLDDHSASGSTPINLGEEGTPVEVTPSSSTVHARPLGQKAQRAAKKKCRQDETSQLLTQMKRIADLGERDLEHRLQLREEAKITQQRADDATTMAVDPSKYSGPVRAYWENKQAMIIAREQQASYPTPTPNLDDDFGDEYVPGNDNNWMGGN